MFAALVVGWPAMNADELCSQQRAELLQGAHVRHLLDVLF